MALVNDQRTEVVVDNYFPGFPTPFFMSPNLELKKTPNMPRM